MGRLEAGLAQHVPIIAQSLSCTIIVPSIEGLSNVCEIARQYGCKVSRQVEYVEHSFSLFAQ